MLKVKALSNALLCVIAIVASAAINGCGGATASTADTSRTLSEFRTAMTATVSDAETSAAHSRVVQRLVTSDALMGMRRPEVEESIGRGDTCSRHPRCEELEFAGNDWFYSVGGFGGVQVPLLIVGFDPSGRVDRTWNLRTH